MKAKIVTTSEIKQEWLDEVREHIPGIEFDISHTTEKLQVWYDVREKSFYGVFAHLRQILNAPTGYRYRVYNMSEAERKALGISNHLAAYDNRDRDGVLDFYMGIPLRLTAKSRLNGFKYNWSKTFVHECTHGEEQENGREYLALVNPDRTHDWEAQGRLKELAAENFTTKEQKLTIVMLQYIVTLWKRLNFLKNN